MTTEDDSPGVDIHETPVDIDEVDYIDDRGGPKTSEPVQIATLTRVGGATVKIAFRGVGYLLNDNGKTIETLRPR